MRQEKTLKEFTWRLMAKIILGLDPGTTRIGYGLIKKVGGDLIPLDYGVIEIEAASAARRLLYLRRRLQLLQKKYHPQLIGLERLYFAKNRKTALAVAEARGVIILFSAENQIPLIEFDPSEAKKMVTGDGRADKGAVAAVVKLILRLKQKPQPDDAADALALAISAAGLTAQKH